MLATTADRGPVPFSYVLGDQLVILAVDDDPIQREFCAVYLATPHAEIRTAGSAEEGLALLEQARFDVVLIDVDMPGINGIEMVRRIRAERRYDDVPLMVITGREDIVSIDQAYAAGATSFMCKPVNWRLLGHQIRFLVRAHRALGGA